MAVRSAESAVAAPPGKRLSYVWDCDIDEHRFRQLLAGELRIGRLDRKWAAIRLIEHAPYAEIVRVLGFTELVRGWPEWRGRVRSKSRRRGLDFLVAWLPKAHPELLASE
jgi:hypothetical protein